MEKSKQIRIENVFDVLASLTDFTLIAGLDQEKVPVVRKLLAQKNVYFEKLLGPSFREGAQQEVTLQDIDGPTLKTIIKFIYSDGIDLTEECVADILDGASRMELVTLEKLCEEFLQKNLCDENCFETFVLADKHCFEMLRASALECVATNLECVPKTDLLQLGGRVLGELLECGKVEMVETSLFNLLVEWVEQNEIVHPPFMPNLLKSIRLEHLPGEFIVNVAEPIFNRYELNGLISAEYRRRVLKHRTNPRRLNEKFVGKSIFYANMMADSIDIYKCYPDFKKLSSITFCTDRNDQGWVFHGGQLYQMGGYYSAGGGRTSDEVECMDMDTRERTKLPNMLSARSSFKPVGFGKYIYVFGGKNKNGPMDDCERFDIQRNQWEALPRMPSRLQNSIAAQVNGKVFVVGSSGSFSSMYWCEYDHGAGRWSDAKPFSGDMDNFTTINPKKHMLNVILLEKQIHMIDTRSSPSVYLGERSLLLLNLNIWRIVECAGSLYIFYSEYCDRTDKFGKLMFSGIECHIVDSVETGEHFQSGFLFMQ